MEACDKQIIYTICIYNVYVYLRALLILAHLRTSSENITKFISVRGLIWNVFYL